MASFVSFTDGKNQQLGIAQRIDKVNSVNDMNEM